MRILMTALLATCCMMATQAEATSLATMANGSTTANTNTSSALDTALSQCSALVTRDAVGNPNQAEVRTCMRGRGFNMPAVDNQTSAGINGNVPVVENPGRSVNSRSNVNTSGNIRIDNRGTLPRTPVADAQGNISVDTRGTLPNTVVGNSTNGRVNSNTAIDTRGSLPRTSVGVQNSTSGPVNNPDSGVRIQNSTNGNVSITGAKSR